MGVDIPRPFSFGDPAARRESSNAGFPAEAISASEAQFIAGYAPLTRNKENLGGYKILVRTTFLYGSFEPRNTGDPVSIETREGAEERTAIGRDEYFLRAGTVAQNFKDLRSEKPGLSRSCRGVGVDEAVRRGKGFTGLSE